MELPTPTWFPELFSALLSGRHLTAAEVTDAVRDLVAGRVDEVRGAAFITALRMKGETAEEVAAAALVLREQMLQLVPVSGPVLDTCGTGGDDSGTFNISTAAALVACGAGVPVVKHGGRAVSSKSGSADVLRELGVPIEAGPEWAQQCLDRTGFAFCFAPHFHRGMAHVSALRKKLGVRTLFNLLGPLANPANAPYQLLGVGKSELLDPLAAALARLGVRQAVLVCSRDGLDEVSLTAPTMVRVVRGNEYEAREWQPSEFGLAPVPLAAIRAQDATESAAAVRGVLAGADGPARRIVLANAAAALWAAEAVQTLREGVERAEAALDAGKPRAVLEALCRSASRAG
ncbi:Anthranilate phosphoribosyltransferase [Gemmata obscuriglobus]|uniref:anthranilate phosphoribosyltransferase n=1 Tax=Gemmata obscuriglobus TaxID=114 RepID=UPI0011CD00CF|nr:anthranilate phosphoribosyltransferase [Gemmata obscuriglobus]QEG32233.1 Anthranilate phosphoribosyltransferase [Gemmata obscuriglobus]VTS11586.1 anthranilate phosphoribosyltransferase : Anthranilate phosphoribosyltransferase OS=Methanocaldococcus infernus (strain DSM 11812 / JCM 15783 / ME) GN=trpD PE=3 SV=1: Glycos_trans_3N: Glycos_transf_3 [Gemmata obscuriglobus UQM 2246]